MQTCCNSASRTRLLLQRPRRGLLDVLVRAVRQFHHPSHGVGRVILLIRPRRFRFRLQPPPRTIHRPRDTRSARPLAFAKRAVRLARLTTLPIRSLFTLFTNSSRFRSRSSMRPVQLRRVVVPQILGVEVLEVRRRFDERAPPFRHLLAIDGEKTVHMNPFRNRVPRRLQHARPEERVEVHDVLADEVVDLAIVALPPIFEVFPGFVAPLAGGGHVADRGIEPDVPVVPRLTGDLETRNTAAGRDTSQSRRGSERNWPAR